LRNSGQKRCRDDEKRRAIRRGACDGLGPDRAARPRPVFDDHGRSPAAPGLVRHQPRDDIGGAARRVRDDYANGPSDLSCRLTIRGKNNVPPATATSTTKPKKNRRKCLIAPCYTRTAPKYGCENVRRVALAQSIRTARTSRTKTSLARLR